METVSQRAEIKVSANVDFNECLYPIIAFIRLVINGKKRNYKIEASLEPPKTFQSTISCLDLQKSGFLDEWNVMQESAKTHA